VISDKRKTGLLSLFIAVFLITYHSSLSSEGLVVEAYSAAIVVLMTAGSQEEATRLAEMLVGAHLAACVQILPQMESVYRWQGEVHRAPEFLLLAKTTSACFDELEREVRALHTYDTPEIVAVPITHISAPYFDWLTSNAFPPLVSRQG
jgi:periplasmic divalent cation tolerance protein